MPVMTETTSTNGKGALSARRQGPAAPSAVQRHRQVPWIVAGVLLVVGCALAFGVASVRASHGEDVLALARSVPAGRVVQPGDLRVVKVTPTAGLDPVPAVSESSTVGRPAAVALVAGTLLTPAELGTPSGGSGDVVAVALRAGAYPPSLGPGGRVDVVPVVGGGSSSGSAPISGHSGSIGAVVLSVDATPAGSSADAVVSLQVNPADADEVAALAAAGQIALVELPSGSGS
jgi:hypothetical protein